MQITEQAFWLGFGAGALSLLLVWTALLLMGVLRKALTEREKEALELGWCALAEEGSSGDQVDWSKCGPAARAYGGPFHPYGDDQETPDADH